MATGTTIKLATNIPLVGVLTYVDFAKSKTEGWGDQIALKGHFDGFGEGRVYLADWLAKSMIEHGLIETNGTDRDGNQAYRVLHKGRVQILREEHGGKKVTTILPLDPNTAPNAAPTAAGAASAPPVQTGYEQARAQARPAPAQVVSTPASVPHTNDPWRELERQYEKARVIACRVWGEDFAAEALVAATATVFIQAQKQGLASPAKSFEPMPNAIDRNEPMPWD